MTFLVWKERTDTVLDRFFRTS